MGGLGEGGGARDFVGSVRIFFIEKGGLND